MWYIIRSKQIYDKNKITKKTTIKVFLKRLKPVQEGPHAGLLRCVREEGIPCTPSNKEVVLADDKSKCAIVN